MEPSRPQELPPGAPAAHLRRCRSSHFARGHSLLKLVEKRAPARGARLPRTHEGLDQLPFPHGVRPTTSAVLATHVPLAPRASSPFLAFHFHLLSFVSSFRAAIAALGEERVSTKNISSIRENYRRGGHMADLGVEAESPGIPDALLPLQVPASGYVAMPSPLVASSTYAIRMGTGNPSWPALLWRSAPRRVLRCWPRCFSRRVGSPRASLRQRDRRVW